MRIQRNFCFQPWNYAFVSLSTIGDGRRLAACYVLYQQSHLLRGKPNLLCTFAYLKSLCFFWPRTKLSQEIKLLALCQHSPYKTGIITEGGSQGYCEFNTFIDLKYFQHLPYSKSSVSAVTTITIHNGILVFTSFLPAHEERLKTLASFAQWLECQHKESQFDCRSGMRRHSKSSRCCCYVL